MQPKDRTKRKIASLRRKVYAHYRRHGRHELPWRATSDPYAILVSEVMLQQTQVSRVERKYAAFINRFPDVKSLAAASVPAVLRAWQGMGYNRRALNLKRAAEMIEQDFNGKVPRDIASLDRLPGIGPNSAAAIMAYAFDRPAPYIETNIRALFIHEFFPRKRSVSDEELLPLISLAYDTTHPRRWCNALMDYGVLIKARHANPSRRSSQHAPQKAFKGSMRELRGKILKAALAGVTKRAIIGRYGERGRSAYLALENEGFFSRSGPR